MTNRSTVGALLAGLGILALVAWAVVAYRGGDAAAIRGAGIGAGLGAAGSLLEAWLVTDALRRPRGQALRIVLLGFLFRLVLLVGISLILKSTGLADAAAFALCFLGGFLASLPLLAAATGGSAPRNGEARP